MNSVPAFSSLILLGSFVSLIVVAEASLISCGQGSSVCTSDQTCVSTQPFSGHKWACAPFRRAVICADSRFSCPEHTTCDMEHMMCVANQQNKKIPVQENVRGRRPVRSSLTASSHNLPSFCSIVAPDMPSFCVCQDNTLGGNVTCSEVLPGSIDTVSVVADISPCLEPASISLTLQETRFGVAFTLAHLATREDVVIPVPGVSFDIPEIADAGLDLVLRFDGDLQEMEVKFGVNVCAEVATSKLCLSSFTKYFPVFFLDGKFQFSSFCIPPSRDDSSRVDIV